MSCCVCRAISKVLVSNGCDEKSFFFWTKAQKRRFYLNFLVKIFNLTITEGNPWPFYVPTHPFGIVAHFFGLDDTFKVSFILISMLYFYNDRTVLDTVRK